MARVFSEQEIVRRESLQELKALGVDPYPAEMFEVNTTSKNIKENYKEGDFLEVVLAGRLMSRRIMGKASFAEIQDREGRIQVYINRDEICQEDDKTMYNTIFKRLLDIGDIIGVKGVVFVTKVGEISVKVKELKVLTKSLRPLPLPKLDADGVAHDTFTDPEKDIDRDT